MNTPQLSKKNNVPHPHPITLRPGDLAKRLGVTERHIHRLAKHPDPAVRLPASLKVGRATLWRYDDILAWVERQAENSAA